MKKKSSKSISKDKDSGKDKSKSKSKSKEKVDKSDNKSDNKSVKSGKSSKSLKAKLEKKKSTASKADSSIVARDASPHTSQLDIIPQESTRLEAKTVLTSFPNRDVLSHPGYSNQKPEKRCDGCFDGEAAVFCKDCNKQFCKICEDQIHIIPVHRNHQR